MRERPGLPIERITIETQFAEQADICGLCGMIMCQTKHDEEFWGSTVIVLAEDVPAYVCHDCDHEQSDLASHIEFLEKARDIFTREQDHSNTEAAAWEVWAAKRVEQLRKGNHG